jgi:succinylglutamate desuccinylase
MQDESTGVVEAPGGFRRIVGRVRGERAGPSLIVLGGIHGNEPAGVRAAERVLAAVTRVQPRLRGELALVAGNLQALERKVRYIDRDLNRSWTEDHVAAVRAQGAGARRASEDQELRALLDVLEELVRAARGPVHFLDLHTSSANGPPFVTVGDTLRNRRFALCFPVPIILGLEEQVDGAALEYVNNLGCITLGVEGGQHEDPRAVEHHESVIWLALAGAGLLAADALPDHEAHRRRLQRACHDAPRVIEVRERHGLGHDDGFRMRPGFSNFQRVRRGTPLADDRRGPILAPQDGRILLPLYQAKGNDGFFVCRDVGLFWLRLSGLLRRMRLGSLAALLPGVRRHPQRRDVLVVNTRIARLYPLEIFHLLGYRKLRHEGAQLVVSRRRFDLAAPRQIQFS